MRTFKLRTVLEGYFLFKKRKINRTRQHWLVENRVSWKEKKSQDSLSLARGGGGGRETKCVHVPLQSVMGSLKVAGTNI